jgi:type VI secretion system protein ImpJ
MRNPPVHWFQGMFLRPQHFQAADRYWLERETTSQQFDHPYGYGLRAIQLPPAVALQNGQLEVSGLKARLRDGTLVVQEASDVQRIELGDRFANLDIANVVVYIAVASIQEGQTNVARGAESAVTCRYVEFTRSSPDESFGDEPQEIHHKRVNAQIVFSTDDLSGFETVPICRLVRSSKGDGTFVIDEDFFPCCLALDAWPPLAAIVRSIYDLIGSRIHELSAELTENSVDMSNMHPGDLEKLWMISTLNEAYGELTNLAFAPGVHPFTAYTALCGIIGRVAIFGETRAIPTLERYDHEGKSPQFKAIHNELKRLIFSVRGNNVIRRDFIGSGNGMQVSLEQEWFSTGWDWYFGVNPLNLKAHEGMKLLKDYIDWKLGSSDRVGYLFENRAEGVRLIPVEQTPRALPARGNWLFFKISTDNEEWRHVQVTQTLAMRVGSEQIANLDSLPGAKRIRVMVGGKVFGLEFSVFAVQTRD